ncbi:MAG: hypothetical protein ACLTH3_09470 [Lachnospira sp.]
MKWQMRSSRLPLRCLKYGVAARYAWTGLWSRTDLLCLMAKSWQSSVTWRVARKSKGWLPACRQPTPDVDDCKQLEELSIAIEEEQEV